MASIMWHCGVREPIMFLHCEYTSTGENLPFLEEEYEIATENGVFQMNGRWSDNPIVL